MGSRTPISPVEATATSIGAEPELGRGVLGGGVGVLEALGPGAGVGAAGVEDDGPRPLAGQHLPAPEHRRGREAVGGEDGRGGVVRTVVEDDGDVGVAGGLEPGGDAGGARTPAGRWRSRRDSYEREGRWSRAGRGRGWRTGSPLPRCPWSGCRRRRRRPAGRRRRRPRSAARRCWRRAPAPSSATGPRAAGARTARRRRPSRRRRGRPAASVPGRSLAEQVARMPRLIGTSVGVKLTLTGAPAACDRFWIISGVCRCTPPTP